MPGSPHVIPEEVGIASGAWMIPLRISPFAGFLAEARTVSAYHCT
jgi:hypothetical protein